MYAGLDVGSRTIKLVMLDTAVRLSQIVETGVNPLARCRQLLAGRNYAKLMVTGYGRHLAAPAFDGEVVTEIKAFATGARFLYPDCHTVIDIGGQDSKVISLSAQGEVQKFEMNDRCAAGTGKFLEVMAQTLEVSLTEMSQLALSGNKKIQINSLCTVFSESEVVSLIARGEKANDIALALHEAIATRIVPMVRRIGIRNKVVFAGGASLNNCLRKLLQDKLSVELIIPESPQTVGAIGAAWLAREASLAVT
jgi:(R)-2-hydroxyacyl-CoA dehydratese activating ATPase